MAQKKLTLKEELEILRGAPIKLKTPVEQVPCNETSDPEKLCKHPVVSVHMLAYNHEKYIREAIEGVMMQETDFEYELIIGEDASPDRTREICFEYQKKYPDKIRVLWSEENVTKPYGGNGARVTARCRGEFIAFCEGDDYWTDPKKLQKQVDIMRQYPSVGLVHGGAKLYWQDRNEFEIWEGTKVFPKGLIPGKQHLSWQLFGKTAKLNLFGPEFFLMTATTLVRREVFQECAKKYSIFSWRLLLGDLMWWLALASLSDVYFIPEVLSVYRRHSKGATESGGVKIWFEGYLVRLYFIRDLLSLSLGKSPYSFRRNFFLVFCESLPLLRKKQADYIKEVFKVSGFCKAFLFSRYFPIMVLARFGIITKGLRKYVWRYVTFCDKFQNKSEAFVE